MMFDSYTTSSKKYSEYYPHPASKNNRNGNSSSNVTITIVHKYEEPKSTKEDNFNYFQERIYKPASHNDKVFTLAKEVRTQELKKEMYVDEFYIENVFTKAERAIEDRYIVNISVYDLALEILNLMKYTDDSKLMRTIVVEADIDDRLHEIKKQYHKYNI